MVENGDGESASFTCSNPFPCQYDSVLPQMQRKVVYNESMQGSGVDGQSEQNGERRKSKIIKLILCPVIPSTNHVNYYVTFDTRPRPRAAQSVHVTVLISSVCVLPQYLV